MVKLYLKETFNNFFVHAVSPHNKTVYKTTYKMFSKKLNKKLKKEAFFSLGLQTKKLLLRKNIRSVCMIYSGNRIQIFSFLKGLDTPLLCFERFVKTSLLPFNGVREKKVRRLLVIGKCLSGLKYQP